MDFGFVFELSDLVQDFFFVVSRIFLNISCFLHNRFEFMMKKLWNFAVSRKCYFTDLLVNLKFWILNVSDSIQNFVLWKHYRLFFFLTFSTQLLNLSFQFGFCCCEFIYFLFAMLRDLWRVLSYNVRCSHRFFLLQNFSFVSAVPFGWSLCTSGISGSCSIADEYIKKVKFVSQKEFLFGYYVRVPFGS